MQELSNVTQKDIERGACIGILGGERVSTKHKGCVGIQQNNSHYLATIPKTERFPNHAFSMKHQGSILRYANHGCYEAANSRLTANGISVQVWSTKTIKAGSEASVHFSYVPPIRVCCCRSLSTTPLPSKTTKQWRGQLRAIARALSAEDSCISIDWKAIYIFLNLV
jgi:hypothetical protein